MNLPLGAPGPGHLRRHSNLAASPPNKSAPVTPLNRSTSNVNAASSSIPYSAVYVFCANNYVGSPLKVRSESTSSQECVRLGLLSSMSYFCVNFYVNHLTRLVDVKIKLFGFIYYRVNPFHAYILVIQNRWLNKASISLLVTRWRKKGWRD